MALLVLLPSLASAAACIWFADTNSIKQVNTDDNSVVAEAPLGDPRRLVMNDTDCGVWTLDKHDRRLLRYNPEGALVLELWVRSLDHRLDEVELLQLDPYDGSLWIADERRLAHVSSSGQLLASFSAPGEARRMGVALDQSLWVLGKRALWRFDALGTLLASYTLGRHLASDARYFAVDSLGGQIWLADERELAQLKLVNPGEPPLRIRLKHDISGLALDPLTGNVWVAHKEALLAYSRAGLLVHTVDLEGLRIRKPEKLAFDPVSRSLWVGAERSVSRFTDTGQFVIRFPARDGDEALGVPAFRVDPTLTLIRPPQDALTNSSRPSFALGYGAICNGQSCAFGNDYFTGFSLTALLNNQPVGSSFIFDPKTAEVEFTPSARLPEGANTFSAQAKDGFGRLSNTISNAFTVDTVAPSFITLSPANGIVFQSPQVTLQGSVDDPQATVVLEGLGLTQTGTNFSFPAILQPGANVFTLSAIDRAGNRTSVQRTLIRASLSISVSTPSPSTTVSGSSVLVSGTVNGPPNTGITVNGVVAAIQGGRFYATVPLQPGPNVLTLTAKTLDGVSVQQSISVTGSGPAVVEVSAEPVSGIAPLKVRFAVNGTITVQRIDADFDGNGTTDFTTTNPGAPIEFTYSQPGIYPARFVVTDGLGNPTTQTLQIVVQDQQQLDQLLRQVWGGMTAMLVRGDKAAAMQYLNLQAKEKYGPVFDALLPNMPQVLGTFSDLKSVAIDSTVGEYAVNRIINGVNRIFFIYFLRDVDGVWRVDSM